NRRSLISSPCDQDERRIGDEGNHGNRRQEGHGFPVQGIQNERQGFDDHKHHECPTFRFRTYPRPLSARKVYAVSLLMSGLAHLQETAGALISSSETREPASQPLRSNRRPFR